MTTIDSLLKSARELNAQAYAALYDGMTEELRTYIDYKGQFQSELYKFVVPVDFSVASIVPDQVYAAAVAQPMQERRLKDCASALALAKLACSVSRTPSTWAIPRASRPQTLSERFAVRRHLTTPMVCLIPAGAPSSR
ncbi:hypothetical protein [Duganella fentianensis]|uniref:hypothetical protein n=1 Tax=Duganella fentianensis TaxID=2692177 RepID=UPI0032B1FEDA